MIDSFLNKDYTYLVFGLLIIFLALLFSKKLGNQPVVLNLEKIGFNLNADRLTLFFLLGFLLIGVGVFFKFKGYETRLSSLEKDLKGKETIAELSSRLGEYELKLSLEFDTSINVNPKDLTYWIRGKVSGKPNIEDEIKPDEFLQLSGIPIFHLEHIKQGDNFHIIAQKSKDERWISEAVEIPKTTIKIKR